MKMHKMTRPILDPAWNLEGFQKGDCPLFHE